MFEPPDVVLADLDAVLDRVTGINLAGLDRAELRDVVCRLQRVQARVNAVTETATGRPIRRVCRWMIRLPGSVTRSRCTRMLRLARSVMTCGWAGSW